MWIIQPTEIEQWGRPQGKWRMTATSDEGGGGPYGDETHSHNTEAEAQDCLACLTYCHRVAEQSNWQNPKREKEDINELAARAEAINRDNGWELTLKSDWPVLKTDTAQVKTLCTSMALIHSEVAEATEAVRKLDRQNFNEELADVIIRAITIAHGLGIDIQREIDQKLETNKGRGFRHGGKTI